MAPKAFVTGATGMTGSHLAERLVKDGFEVYALVRETSDTSFLKELKVNLVQGDLASGPNEFVPMVEGMDYVFHLAANVDDWGEREEMYAVNVGGLQGLLDACVGKPIKRFLYVSSMAVLGMGEQIDLDESAPYVQTGDNYNYTKIEAEKLAIRYAREKQVPISIIRPPYMYGPRDRQFFPRIINALKDGSFAYINHGEIEFTICYVLNAVEALMLAAQKDCAVGQLYMVTDGEAITRRELVETICEGLGFEKPTKSFPLWGAKLACPFYELKAMLLKQKPPRLNKFRLKFMAARMTFNISKAQRELGYGPPYKCREALRETVRWFKEHEAP